MKIREIMTKDVIAVGPRTAIRDAARLMAEHAVSGLPVVDDTGKVVGIVSEGDLILREKPRERLPWWRLFFGDGERLAREYQKATGTTVEEVMSRDVVSVGPEDPIEAAAAILDRLKIRRLPVIEEGQLVGIVSRGDLVKALALAPLPEGRAASDAALAEEMRRRLESEPWVTNRAIVVQATAGVLSLWGLVLSEAEKSALETMARAIPGAKGVDSHLLVRSELAHHYGV